MLYSIRTKCVVVHENFATIIHIRKYIDISLHRMYVYVHLYVCCSHRIVLT